MMRLGLLAVMVLLGVALLVPGPNLPAQAAGPVIYVPAVQGGTGATPTATSTPIPGAPTATSTTAPTATNTPGAAATATFTPVTGACPALSISTPTIGGIVTDQFTWRDSACLTRSASLARNGVGGDPKGGSAKQFTYTLAGGSVRTVGEAPEAGGFGYVVSHLEDATIANRNGDDDSPLGSSLNNAFSTIFVGNYHALHQYTLNYPRWGVVGGVDTKYTVPVTVQWLFITGKDAPIWSITYDLSAAPANAISADTRAPYGDMLFDGATAAATDEVGSIAWGDKFNFKTTTPPFPLTLSRDWTWNTPNTGPAYNALTTRNTDAEMGIVGTRVISKQDAGGYGGAENARNSTSANAAARCPADPPDPAFRLPCLWQWSFQSINYAFYSGAGGALQTTAPTTDKRLAWGADWGYLGKQTVTTINGNTVTGWPKVSYSTQIVLGPKSAQPTLALGGQVAAQDASSLTASVGTVLTQGPAGVADTTPKAYSPVGYNPVYGTWEVNAAANKAALTFTAGAIAVQKPVFVIHDRTGIIGLTLNGTALVPGIDYYPSQIGTDLWFTLNKTLSGVNTIALN